MLAAKCFVEMLPQKSEQFFCRPEPQVLSRINFFHSSFEPPQRGFRFRSKPNNECCVHNKLTVGFFRRQGVSFPLNFRDVYSDIVASSGSSAGRPRLGQGVIDAPGRSLTARLLWATSRRFVTQPRVSAEIPLVPLGRPE